MKTRITIILTVLYFATGMAGDIKFPNGIKPARPETNNTELRNSCTASTSQVDLSINNVRARLLGGGDMWWDLSNGKYIIPNVAPGEPEVSSVFASALWVGGIDAAGNLKMAAQTYRQAGNDFWAGPIEETAFETDIITCLQWDRHFSVLGTEINDLRADYLSDDDGDGQSDYSVDNTPAESLLQWPGRGNPYFATEVGFNLPDQDLAPFYDQNGDGIYNPYDGDIPILAVSGIDDCAFAPYADQMIWWVYNDIGNIHTETGGDQIGIEIQMMAFAYATDDAINDMTFYNYKLINRSADVLENTYIGLWVDPDLGCWNNDYVGCQIDKRMGIVYNGEVIDEDCLTGLGVLNGYGEEVPMFGVDILRGPIDENGNELGMSSFVVYNNDFSATGNPETTEDYYNYLAGFWKDDTPVEYGGNGYMQGTNPSPYMYPSVPADVSPDAWSECSENNAPGDRRFVLSTGLFTLEPGATNQIVTGALWVPDVQYPCPTFDKILAADSLAQNLFDGCFDLATSVEDVHPESTALNALSVFPNPGYFGASQEVTINNVPEQSVISIYTIDGKQIRQLNNQGDTLTWDMKANNGQIVPMGTYIIHIDASTSNNGMKAIKWIGGQ